MNSARFTHKETAIVSQPLWDRADFASSVVVASIRRAARWWQTVGKIHVGSRHFIAESANDPEGELSVQRGAVQAFATSCGSTVPAGPRSVNVTEPSAPVGLGFT